MRFDDTLETVLASDLGSPYGAQSAWRQLVDLIGRRRAAAGNRAMGVLRTIRESVPLPVRAASARALEHADPPPPLVRLFALDELQVALPVLRSCLLYTSSVALAGGIVSINGRPVPQKQIGTEIAGEPGVPARKLLEQFPGEAQPHAILDQQATPQDDFAAVVVPAGHLFVMGDNRDNSADSRFPRDSFGVGMLPEKDALGRVDFISWSMERPGRFDRPITRIDR